MKWIKQDSPNCEKWESECKDFDILKTKSGKFRLVAFGEDYEERRTTQFPDAEFWMMEFPTLEAAQQHAAKM